MPNFAEISQTVAVIWPFFNYSTFRFFKVAEAAILDFKNVEILGVERLRTAKLHHRTKFRGDTAKPLLRYDHFSIFQDDGRRHREF